MIFMQMGRSGSGCDKETLGYRLRASKFYVDCVILGLIVPDTSLQGLLYGMSDYCNDFY